MGYNLLSISMEVPHIEVLETQYGFNNLNLFLNTNFY